MKHPSVTAKPSRTWRDISQELPVRTVSRSGRRRNRMQVIRVALLGVVALACVAGCYKLYRKIENQNLSSVAKVSENPIRHIVLKTDGVVDDAWLAGVLKISDNTGMLDVDLVQMKKRLLSHPQIRLAVVEREFPDTLKINLSERIPVLRMMLSEAGSKPHMMLIDRDGAVFDPENYGPKMLASLPWVSGVSLHRGDSGYEAIQGMDTVSELLGTAMASMPRRYESFQIVDMSRLVSDQEIKVTSKDAKVIVFGADGDFYRQLARLDYILDELRQRPGINGLDRIDLTLGGQIPIAFDMDKNAKVQTQVAAVTHSLFQLNSSRSSMGGQRRDF